MGINVDAANDVVTMLVRLASCKLLVLPAVSNDLPRDCRTAVSADRDCAVAKEENDGEDEDEQRHVVLVALTAITRHCGLGM